MRVSDFLCRDATIADMKAQDKDTALVELADAAARAGLDKDAALSVLLEREALGSTAVGDGYAIPHGKMKGLPSMVIIFARSRAGIDFSAPDGRKCHFFFMVLAPESATGKHLGLLGSIARLAKDPTFTTRLMQAKDAAEIASFLSGT